MRSRRLGYVQSRFSLLLKVRGLGLLLAALAIWVFVQIADEVLEKDT